MLRLWRFAVAVAALADTEAPGFTTTLAGSGNATSVDGVGELASFHGPWAIAISADGTFALVTESSPRAAAVRRIDLTGSAEVTTISGGGAKGFADGRGAAVQWGHPADIAIAPDSSYALVADEPNGELRRLALPSGDVRPWLEMDRVSAVDIARRAGAFIPDNGHHRGAFVVAGSRKHQFIRLVQVVAATGDAASASDAEPLRLRRPPVLEVSHSALMHGLAIAPDRASVISSYANKHPKTSQLKRYDLAAANDVEGTDGRDLTAALSGGSAAVDEGFADPRGIALSPDGSFALVVDSDHAVAWFDVLARQKRHFAGFDRRAAAVEEKEKKRQKKKEGGGRRLSSAERRAREAAEKLRRGAGFADGAAGIARFDGAHGIAIAPDGTYALVCDSANHRVRRIAIQSAKGARKLVHETLARMTVAAEKQAKHAKREEEQLRLAAARSAQLLSDEQKQAEKARKARDAPREAPDLTEEDLGHEVEL
jgi:DNA-binding beta-propeller fold protein YncE